MRKQIASEPLCYHCGKPSHTVKACPKVLRHVCGERGHLARDSRRPWMMPGMVALRQEEVEAMRVEKEHAVNVADADWPAMSGMSRNVVEEGDSSTYRR